MPYPEPLLVHLPMILCFGVELGLRRSVGRVYHFQKKKKPIASPWRNPSIIDKKAVRGAFAPLSSGGGANTSVYFILFSSKATFCLSGLISKFD